MERRHSESDLGEGESRLVNPVAPQNDSVKVLTVFLLYTMTMCSVPFLAFFGTKYTLKHYFHVEGFANTAWSVVAAVVVVNIIILTYACRGYEEMKEDEKRDGDNQSTSHEKKDKSNLNLKKTN